MSSQTLPSPSRPAKLRARRALPLVLGLILIGAMALDTKVVRIGSSTDIQPGVFSPAAFGKSEFPKVQAAVESRAVDAGTLASAIASDKAAAGKQYGVDAGLGPEIPVKFTGVAGKEDAGVYDIAIDGISGVLVRVQTGPAIMGTDLRDSTGAITFGQFTNQIEYQNAGSALNKEMKKQVLSKAVTGPLTGKTVAVVGVFQLTDPNAWLVTPVNLEVK